MSPAKRLRQCSPVDLVQHFGAAELGHYGVYEVAPIGAHGERRIQVHDHRAAREHRRCEPHGTDDEPRGASECTLVATLAANLEVDQRKLLCEARLQQQTHVCAHATQRIAARPEQERRRPPHLGPHAGTRARASGQGARTLTLGCLTLGCRDTVHHLQLLVSAKTPPAAAGASALQ